MITPPDWAIEIAEKILESDHHSIDINLMDHPYGFDATTAIAVYDALVFLQEKKTEDDQ